MKIQRATIHDLNEIAALSREVWVANFTCFLSEAQIDYMLSRSYTPEAMQHDIENRESTYIKAVVDHQMIGYAAYRPAGPTGRLLLDKIYVHPTHQHHGYGYQLFQHVEKKAMEAGYFDIVLYVSQFNTAAVTTYATWGFEIAGSKEENIGKNFVIHDYIMKRELDFMTG